MNKDREERGELGSSLGGGEGVRGRSYEAWGLLQILAFTPCE